MCMDFDLDTYYAEQTHRMNLPDKVAESYLRTSVTSQELDVPYTHIQHQGMASTADVDQPLYNESTSTSTNTSSETSKPEVDSRSGRISKRKASPLDLLKDNGSGVDKRRKASDIQDIAFDLPESSPAHASQSPIAQTPEGGHSAPAAEEVEDIDSFTVSELQIPVPRTIVPRRHSPKKKGAKTDNHTPQRTPETTVDHSPISSFSRIINDSPPKSRKQVAPIILRNAPLDLRPLAEVETAIPKKHNEEGSSESPSKMKKAVTAESSELFLQFKERVAQHASVKSSSSKLISKKSKGKKGKKGKAAPLVNESAVIDGSSSTKANQNQNGKVILPFKRITASAYIQSLRDKAAAKNALVPNINSSDEPQSEDEGHCYDFLRYCHILYISQDMDTSGMSEETRERLDLIAKHGGNLMLKFDPDVTTHILTEEVNRPTVLQKLGLRSMEEVSFRTNIVTWGWFINKNLDYTDSLERKALAKATANSDKEKAVDPLDEFREEAERMLAVAAENRWSNFGEGMLVRDNDTEDEEDDIPPPASKTKKKGFLCDTPDIDRQGVCPNQDVVDKLTELKQLHEAKLGPDNKWRALSYAKCINPIKNHPRRIRSLKEAATIPGVGQKTALKIMEIIETGDLQRIKYVNTEDVRVAQVFKEIYGVGGMIARQWYNAGCRTLDDLRAGKGGVKLSKVQKIGLKYYDDITDRMPRAEAKAIFDLIKSIALKIDPLLYVEIMGSYRRGKADCGDIDILLTRPTDDGQTHSGMIAVLLRDLHVAGILTDDLALPHDLHELESCYRGLCRLPGVKGAKRRRIDILCVPWKSRGGALLYYTGDSLFNCSMRLKASYMGYSLNQRGLSGGVIRDPNDRRVKLEDGQLIASETEEEIFKILGVEWQEPHQRVRAK